MRLTQEHVDNFSSIMNDISVSFRSQNYWLPWQPLHGHRKRPHSHDSVNLCDSLSVSRHEGNFCASIVLFAEAAAFRPRKASSQSLSFWTHRRLFYTGYFSAFCILYNVLIHFGLNHERTRWVRMLLQVALCFSAAKYLTLFPFCFPMNQFMSHCWWWKDQCWAKSPETVKLLSLFVSCFISFLLWRWCVLLWLWAVCIWLGHASLCTYVNDNINYLRVVYPIWWSTITVMFLGWYIIDFFLEQHQMGSFLNLEIGYL